MNQQYLKKQGASCDGGIRYQIKILTYLACHAFISKNDGKLKSFTIKRFLEIKTANFACGLKYVFKDGSQQHIYLQTKYKQKDDIELKIDSKESIDISLNKAYQNYKILKENKLNSDEDFKNFKFVIITSNKLVDSLGAPYKLYLQCQRRCVCNSFTSNNNLSCSRIKKTFSLKNYPVDSDFKNFISSVVFIRWTPQHIELKKYIEQELNNKLTNFSLHNWQSTYSLLEYEMESWWTSNDDLCNWNDFIPRILKLFNTFGIPEEEKEDSGKHSFGEIFKKIETYHFKTKKQVVVLHGLGDFCTTKYLNEYRYLYDGNIFRIDCGNIAKEFENLAKKFNKIISKDDPGSIQQIYDIFNGRKCLFLFENAMVNSDDFLQYLRLRDIYDHVFFIITSPRRIWEKHFGNIDCNSSLFSDEEKYSNNEERVKRLAINTFSEIEMSPYGELALRIVRMVAYMAPSYIQRDLFSTLDSNPDTVQKAIQLLWMYTLINYSESKLDFSLNRNEYVKNVSRLAMDDFQEDNILKKALGLFSIIDKDSVDHAIYLWKHTYLFEHIQRDHESLVSQIVKVLINEERLEEAVKFGEDVLGSSRTLSAETRAGLQQLIFSLNKKMFVREIHHIIKFVILILLFFPFYLSVYYYALQVG